MREVRAWVLTSNDDVVDVQSVKVVDIIVDGGRNQGRESNKGEKRLLEHLHEKLLSEKRRGEEEWEGAEIRRTIPLLLNCRLVS